MDEWSKLSMADRAKYIKLAIDSGLTDLNHIKTTYNSFARGGYTKWKEKIKKHKDLDIDNDPTYDYEGFYNSDPNRAWDMLNKDSAAHFTDEFKTSLHPSFSNESQYSGYKNKYNPEGITGGTWIDDYNYQLSQSQIDNDWNTDKTLDYFDNNEEHPVFLHAPDGSIMLRSVDVSKGVADISNININNEDNINIEPLRYIHKYLNSEGFKKRLQNVPPDIREEYNNSIIKNANKSINIQQTYPERRSVLGAIGNAIRGIFNEKYQYQYNDTGYNPSKNTIYISADHTPILDTISPDQDFNLAHEYGHKIDPTDSNVYYDEQSKAPKNFIEIHNRKKVDKNNIHDKQYGETYADLTATRYDLYKNGIFDITQGGDFTEEDYYNYLDYLDKNNKHNRLIDQFNKDDVIELMNTIAKNDNGEKKNIVALGGKVNKFDGSESSIIERTDNIPDNFLAVPIENINNGAGSDLLNTWNEQEKAQAHYNDWLRELYEENGITSGAQRTPPKAYLRPVQKVQKEINTRFPNGNYAFFDDEGVGIEPGKFKGNVWVNQFGTLIDANEINDYDRSERRPWAASNAYLGIDNPQLDIDTRREIEKINADDFVEANYSAGTILGGGLGTSMKFFSPSQQFGAIVDAIQGEKGYWEGIGGENSGFFTDRFAKYEPQTVSIGNMTADVILGLVGLEGTDIITNSNNLIRTTGSHLMSKAYRTPIKLLGNKSIRSSLKPLTKGLKKQIDRVGNNINNYDNLIADNIEKYVTTRHPESTVKKMGTDYNNNINMSVSIDEEPKVRDLPVSFLDEDGSFKTQYKRSNVFESEFDKKLSDGRGEHDVLFITYKGERRIIPYSNTSKFARSINSKVNSVEEAIGESGRVGGSSVIYGKDYAQGIPNDIEIVTTESRLTDLQNKLQGSSVQKHGSFGYRMNSPFSYKGEPIDVQVIGEIDGRASGPLAHEYYKLLYPDDYRRIVDEAIDQGFKSGKVVTLDDITFPISAEELYSKITPEIQEQKLLQDMFLSDKNKHVQRAYQMLTHPDATIRAKGRASMKAAMQTHFKDFKLASEEYTNLKFDNIEANKQFLKELGLPLEYAENPDIMQNIVDRWHIANTVQSRNVYIRKGETIYLPDKETMYKALNSTYAPYNGNYSGIGGNTVVYTGKGGLGGDFGGILEQRLTLNPEKMETPYDLLLQKKKLANFEKDNPELYKKFEDIENKMRDGIISEKQGMELQRKFAEEHDIPMYIGKGYNNSYRGNIISPRKTTAYPIEGSTGIAPEIGGTEISNISSSELLKALTNNQVSVNNPSPGLVYADGNLHNKFLMSKMKTDVVHEDILDTFIEALHRNPTKRKDINKALENAKNIYRKAVNKSEEIELQKKLLTWGTAATTIAGAAIMYENSIRAKNERIYDIKRKYNNYGSLEESDYKDLIDLFGLETATKEEIESILKEY